MPCNVWVLITVFLSEEVTLYYLKINAYIFQEHLGPDSVVNRTKKISDLHTNLIGLNAQTASASERDSEACQR